MKKTLILFLFVSTLLFAVEFQEKDNVVIRKNDDGSVSTIPMNRDNLDYTAYLNFKRTGTLPVAKKETSDAEIRTLKQIIRKLVNETKLPLTDNEKAILDIKTDNTHTDTGILITK